MKRHLFIVEQLLALTVIVGFVLALGGCQANRTAPQISRGEGPKLAPVAIPGYVVGESFIFDDGRRETVLRSNGGRITWLRNSGARITGFSDFTIPALSWQTRTRRSTMTTNAQPGMLWPLVVGNDRSFELRQVIERTDARPFDTGEVRREFEQNWRCVVEGTATLEVTAGTFDTFRVSCFRTRPGTGEWRQTRTYYYAPTVGHYVRREDFWARRSDFLTGSAPERIDLVSYGFNSTVLPRQDQVSLNRTLQDVLNRNRDGAGSVWKSPSSVMQVTLTPLRTYRNADGEACREYRSDYRLRKRIRSNSRRVCLQANGLWQRVR